MPQAAFAFVATLLGQLAAGAKLYAAFKAAVVVAGLTAAASVIFKPPKPPPVELSERKLNLRVPTPSRKILYGELEIGASIVDAHVFKDPTAEHILPTESRQRPEIHIMPYRDTRHPINGTTATANAFPVARPLGLGAGANWPIASRSSLQSGGNLAEEWTVYMVNRGGYTGNRYSGVTRRGGVKQLEILYALADNRITINHLFLSNEQIDGQTGVEFNAHGYRGDLYIRPRNLDGDTSTVLARAQEETYDLDHADGGRRSTGHAAGFIWDTSLEGTFQDIVTPLGLEFESSFDLDEQFVWAWVFANYGRRFVGDYERQASDKMGQGTALLAASFFNYGQSTQIPWLSIPVLTVQATGEVSTDTWTEVSRIVNDASIYDGLAYNNTAVCLFDYIRNHTEYGADVLGEGRIDEGSVRQAIIDCDTLGLTCNALVDLNSRPDDVMGQFALAMRRGDVFDVGGILHMIVGKPVAASHTITEDDILTDWSFIGGLPRDQRPDAINLQYNETRNVGNETITLGAEFIKGGGSGVTEELTVAYAGSRDQALDVAAVILLQAQESQSMELPVRAALGRILPNDTVMVDLPTVFGEGAAARKFRVLRVEPQGDLSMRLTIREERDEIWSGYDLISGAGFLLLESGDHVLLESGDKIVV